MQIKEAQRIPNRINPSRPFPRYIRISLSNIKEKQKILKAAREKQYTAYKGNHVRLNSDYSTGAVEARRAWYDIFKILKEKTSNQEFCAQANCPSKLRERLKSSQTNKS